MGGNARGGYLFTSTLLRTARSLVRWYVLMNRSALKRRTPLRVKGISDTTEIKDEIQEVARQIVIKRDGGCILSFTQGSCLIVPFDIPMCNGYRKDGKLVLQADHLITRANSATYADTRLIVCICKGHHKWKEFHKEEYDALVKTLIEPERVKLWEACEQDRWRPHRTGVHDWKLALAALEQELAALEKQRFPQGNFDR